MAYIRGELSRSQEHQEHLQRLNAWQKTELGRAMMSRAVSGCARGHDWHITSKLKAAEAKLDKVELRHFHELCIENGITPSEIHPKFPGKYGNGRYRDQQTLEQACIHASSELARWGIRIGYEELAYLYSWHFWGLV